MSVPFFAPTTRTTRACWDRGDSRKLEVDRLGDVVAVRVYLDGVPHSVPLDPSGVARVICHLLLARKEAMQYLAEHQVKEDDA